MTVFERIHSLAKKQHISMSKLAIQLGFSENLFYRWKTSEPKARDIEKVADYFNVSTDYLLGRTENLYPDFSDEKHELTVEEALNSVMSYDGKPITDHDREVLTGIIEAYLEKNRKNK